MTRHQVETELSDIRREITRLQRREAHLLCNPQDDRALPRPGWPMRRSPGPDLAQMAQASGAMISTSAPLLTAV